MKKILFGLLLLSNIPLAAMQLPMRKALTALLNSIAEDDEYTCYVYRSGALHMGPLTLAKGDTLPFDLLRTGDLVAIDGPGGKQLFHCVVRKEEPNGCQ